MESTAIKTWMVCLSAVCSFISASVVFAASLVPLTDGRGAIDILEVEIVLENSTDFPH